MSEVLRFYLIARQSETKSVHNKLTSKFGQRRKHNQRLYTEGNLASDSKEPSNSNTPSSKLLKSRNYSIAGARDDTVETSSGFSVKMFKERCKSIHHRKREKMTSSVADEKALPDIRERCAPRLSKVNMFNRPSEISFTSFLQKYYDRPEELVKLKSDVSENGKVLTVCISMLQTAEEKSTEKLRTKIFDYGEPVCARQPAKPHFNEMSKYRGRSLKQSQVRDF